MNYDTYLFQINTIDGLVNELLKSNSNITNSKLSEENNLLINSILDQIESMRSNLKKYNYCDNNDSIIEKYNFIEKLNFYSDEDYYDNDSFNNILYELNNMCDDVIVRLKELSCTQTNVNSIINDDINTLYRDMLFIKIEIQYNKTLYDEQKFKKCNLNSLIDFIYEKINSSKRIKEELKLSKKNDDDKFYNLYNILSDVIYFELKKLNECSHKLKNVDLDNNSELDINDYNKKVIDVFINKDNNTSDELLKQITNIYNANHKYVNTINIDEKYSKEEKEQDEIDYKKYCSNLNDSFWYAREKASEEKIKYPSALYERTVKDYQNQYLIEKYNVSLEDVEYFVSQYKEKYYADIYMEKMYSKVLNDIREESDLSIDEICDETYGISILDKGVLKILKEELFNIIREISFVKREENFDDFIDISKYKKSIKLSKLIDKKEMIEKQIQIISFRADKI